MKNKIKVVTAFMLGILITSVSVYAISVKSTNVIFTPEDTEWEVSNVDSALNDLNNEIDIIKRTTAEILPIYDKGTYYYDFNKYGSTYSGLGTVTDYDDYFFITTANGSGSRCTSYFTKIDLSDIDAIYAHTSSANNGYSLWLCVSEYESGFANRNTDAGYGQCVNSSLLKEVDGTANDDYSDIIDVKKLTGTYNVGIGVCKFTSNGDASYAYIDGIYMVKNIFKN